MTEAEHQRDMLLQEITDFVKAVGLVPPEASLDGPEAINALRLVRQNAERLAEQLQENADAAPAHASAVRAVLESARSESNLVRLRDVTEEEYQSIRRLIEHADPPAHRKPVELLAKMEERKRIAVWLGKVSSSVNGIINIPLGVEQPDGTARYASVSDFTSLVESGDLPEPGDDGVIFSAKPIDDGSA